MNTSCIIYILFRKQLTYGSAAEGWLAAGNILEGHHAGELIGSRRLSIGYPGGGRPAAVAVLFDGGQGAPEGATLGARGNVRKDQFREQGLSRKGSRTTEILSAAHQKIAFVVQPKVVRAALAIILWQRQEALKLFPLLESFITVMPYRWQCNGALHLNVVVQGCNELVTTGCAGRISVGIVG